MTGFAHTPVMLDEVVEHLRPRSGGVYADATLGGAGHARAILERSAPDGRLIGVDRDEHALAAAKEALAEFGDRAVVRSAPFSALADVLEEAGSPQVDGLVADLGVSSTQLDRPERGFSFKHDGPIDMRMDQHTGETALELIERLGADDLADVLYKYGEERRSRPIARSIKRRLEEGRLNTTSDLRSAVVSAVGPKRGRIDPATRTFQAIRIAVNDELGELESLLGQLPRVLVEGGIAAIISFHSLEDRMVKWAFRDSDSLEPITKRPLTATEEEAAHNPRSRSAKLRVARRAEVQA